MWLEDGDGERAPVATFVAIWRTETRHHRCENAKKQQSMRASICMCVPVRVHACACVCMRVRACLRVRVRVWACAVVTSVYVMQGCYNWNRTHEVRLCNEQQVIGTIALTQVQYPFLCTRAVPDAVIDACDRADCTALADGAP